MECLFIIIIIGKATGPDDIPMEAIINGGPNLKLAIHLCILFNLFLQYSYLPAGFMHSVIIPLVKDKSGNLSNVNHYRAIAVSTSMSKLFESIIAREVTSCAEADKYQFVNLALKKGIRRAHAQVFLRKLSIIILLTEVVMFLLVSLISLKHLIV